MIDRLAAALQFDQEALNLRHQRQQVLANNIANADTPNFKARDFDFASELSRAMDSGRPAGGGLSLSTTAAGHIAGGSGSAPVGDLLYRVPDQPSLDGNTVNMDVERTRFADNSVRYQAALTMLNGRIQGLKSAMQPE
ncbi:flagellar basal body rod protein FlgB [Alloalcanivorax sp.]|jgi:flagellar basal-body rod protein FlgB|uniref:flagellar basal body rod protein FlgB n=1 Tax=Alloalcanivorax TaxID=3020832 RepID=UPI00351603CD